MDVRRITTDLSVSPQIAPEDVAALKAQGFRSIICNRPDGEDAGQPGYAEIEAMAAEAGLEMRFLPVVSGQVRDEDAEAFGRILKDLPAPVLAYCRSGTRCSILWSLAEAGARPLDEILAATRAAGYDMSAVAPRIAGRSGQGGNGAGG